jgi:predicted adenylyl cyclase CyaB
MERNVEIKARIESVDALLRVAAMLADRRPTEMFQDDTFFACPRGRLKLRAFSHSEGQLIFYRRPDAAGPKESSYIISPTTSPDTLREALSLAYGQTGRVRKHRTVFLLGRTRMHLDRVEGLGEFLELEVVLGQHEPVEAGISIANELLGKLGVSPRQLIKEAYVDLLSNDGRRESRRT